jgi:hypothetical protein
MTLGVVLLSAVSTRVSPAGLGRLPAEADFDE